MGQAPVSIAGVRVEGRGWEVEERAVRARSDELFASRLGGASGRHASRHEVEPNVSLVSRASGEGMRPFLTPAGGCASSRDDPRRGRSRARLLGLVCAFAAILDFLTTAPALADRPLREARIERAIDGDSLVARFGAKRVQIRIADVDAPEWRQAYGIASRELAERLVVGRQARIRSRARDGYGRLVADVYLIDGRSLAAVLVASGLAWHDARFRSNATLAKLQETAQRQRRGLWSSPRPEPPWDFRRRTGRSPGKKRK
jgi:micrococcal nuclease